MNLKSMIVAVREYKTTALTPAFIFGAFIFPLVFYGLMFILPAIITKEVPQLKGEIVVFDQSGADVAGFLKGEFDVEKIDGLKKQIEEIEKNPEKQKEIEEAARAMGGDLAVVAARFAVGRSSPFLGQPTPEVTVRSTDPSSQGVADGDALRQKMQEQIRLGETTAYVEVAADGLVPLAKDKVTLFIAPDLPQDNAEAITYAVKQAGMNARMAAAGLNQAQVQLTMTPVSVSTRNVTETGDSKSVGEAQFFVSLAFMMLLWIGTMTGGQYLLMSTIEEKSSRVMEVLLSAASSRDLMTGKILGQGAVAMTLLLVYAGLGMASIYKFDFMDLVPIERVLILLPYFIMAFMFMACLMAAIGSAVSDIREASSLMNPVMLVIVAPFLVMMPVIQSPNGTLATVASFIPPFTPFIMAMRLGGREQIPMWQIPATLVIGFAAVMVFMWGAAKIFRIGVMLYGKPPSLLTLMKWVAKA